MKCKMPILIITIVILIFTIQASCALDEDNDFNLTQTNDTDTVNIQIDDDSNSLDDENIIANESKSISSEVNMSSENEVLKASNDNNVLGVDRYVTTPTIAYLNSIISSARDGDNIFLMGNTFTGSFTTISVNKAVNIYGGSFIGDTQTATIDFSQVRQSTNPKVKFTAISNVWCKFRQSLLFTYYW